MVRRNTTQQARYRDRHRKTGSACAICGTPIDYTLTWPNPKSFVVDHIIPIAKGGAHTFDNTQAAHADCNSTKRARIIAPIIRRSGTLN